MEGCSLMTNSAQGEKALTCFQKIIDRDPTFAEVGMTGLLNRLDAVDVALPLQPNNALCRQPLQPIHALRMQTLQPTIVALPDRP